VSPIQVYNKRGSSFFQELSFPYHNLLTYNLPSLP
jgi:hypothetical protein